MVSSGLEMLIPNTSGHTLKRIEAALPGEETRIEAFMPLNSCAVYQQCTNSKQQHARHAIKIKRLLDLKLDWILRMSPISRPL